MGGVVRVRFQGPLSLRYKVVQTIADVNPSRALLCDRVPDGVLIRTPSGASAEAMDDAHQ